MNSTVLTERAAGSPQTRLISLGVFAVVLVAAAIYVGVQLGHDLHVAPTSPVF